MPPTSTCSRSTYLPTTRGRRSFADDASSSGTVNCSPRHRWGGGVRLEPGSAGSEASEDGRDKIPLSVEGELVGSGLRAWVFIGSPSEDSCSPARSASKGQSFPCWRCGLVGFGKLPVGA